MVQDTKMLREMIQKRVDDYARASFSLLHHEGIPSSPEFLSTEKESVPYTIPGCSSIPDHIYSINIHRDCSESLELMNESKIWTASAETHECKCAIAQLMAEGCKCGGS